MTSYTCTVKNHHSWADEGWGQLVTLATNFNSFQEPSLVSFDISPQQDLTSLVLSLAISEAQSVKPPQTICFVNMGFMCALGIYIYGQNISRIFLLTIVDCAMLEICLTVFHKVCTDLYS